MVGLASLKGETVKMVFENYRDNHIHILFENGRRISVVVNKMFDEDGNVLVSDAPLITNDEMDRLIADADKLLNKSAPATNLTAKEQAAVDYIAMKGLECMGGYGKAQLKSDNMTWFDVNDIMIGITLRAASGLMSSLQTKGLAIDSGDGVNGQGPNQWYLSDKGIDAANIPD